MFKDYIILFGSLTAIAIAIYLTKCIRGWDRMLTIRILTVLLGSCGLYELICWALRPGFSAFEIFGSPTPLVAAKNLYGPLLLQKYLLEEYHGTINDKNGMEAFT